MHIKLFIYRSCYMGGGGEVKINMNNIEISQAHSAFLAFSRG